MRAFRIAGAALVCLWGCTAAPWAQAPDCSGISDVSAFDGATVSDMVGQLTTVRVASGIPNPVFVTAAPGDNERLFVLDQTGRIRIIKNGVLLNDPFLDIVSDTKCCSERGLLGLAFHPNYQQNGWFFIYHTHKWDDNYVRRYTRLDADHADAASQVEVLHLPHELHGAHNGGMIAFSPWDGRLYVGTGDAGIGCDPQEDGQNLESHLAKLLRLDVDALPYGTSGNPFDGPTAGRDDVWAYGLRNPWRFSFDRGQPQLFIGDVGQSEWEEINCTLATAGGAENYGWDHFEGFACPNPSCGDEGSCLPNAYVDPVRVYDNGPSSCAVIGGYVYRGCRMADLHGTYFYGDYCGRFVRSFRTDGACGVSAAPDLVRTADLAPAGGFPGGITSFGEDNRGELYLTTLNGNVYKIVPRLEILEVSGRGAASFVLDTAGGDWSWEDLQASSSHPLEEYRVYRSIGAADGLFLCLHTTPDPLWVGGDPAVPSPGQVFFYIVTAVGASGAETSPGMRSDGTLRGVETDSCP